MFFISRSFLFPIDSTISPSTRTVGIWNEKVLKFFFCLFEDRKLHEKLSGEICQSKMRADRTIRNMKSAGFKW